MTAHHTRELLVVVTALALAVGSQLLTAGASPDGERRPWQDLLVVIAVLAVAAAVAFGVLAPIARRSATRAGAVSLVLAAVALLGLPVLLWSATTFLLGAAAVLVAGHSSRGALPRAGQVLGGVAAVVNLVLLVIVVADDFRPAMPV